MGKVSTIGYGSASLDSLITRLKDAQVEYLIDVRSKPYSRFRPELNRGRFHLSLQSVGIAYGFMGDVIGGLPKNPVCYTNNHVDYEKCALDSNYLRGIERLINGVDCGYNIALMCSEGKPWKCHRSKLIGISLEKLGFDVNHFLPKRGSMSQSQVIEKLTGGQCELFGSFLRSGRKVKLD